MTLSEYRRWWGEKTLYHVRHLGRWNALHILKCIWWTIWPRWLIPGCNTDDDYYEPCKSCEYNPCAGYLSVPMDAPCRTDIMAIAQYRGNALIEEIPIQYANPIRR